MKKYIYNIILMLSLSVVNAQQTLPKIEIQANKTLALVQYVKEISSSRQSILKDHFKKSKYDTNQVQRLLKEYKKLQLRESIEYQRYPETRRSKKDTDEIFTVMAANSENLEELKRNSISLFPLRTHQKLFSILETIEPIYEQIFWKKNLSVIQQKIAELKAYAQKHNLNKLYNAMTTFYNSSWESDLPLVISVIPYPEKTGFTATPQGNIIVSGLPLDMDYFEVYFGVILHEIAHILYAEQEKSFQFELEKWFLNSPSKYKTFAYNWINETLATAVGNGWVYENLQGELDPLDWYNNIYINTFAKAIYPMVKNYLERNKKIDKAFIEKSISVYEKVLADKTYAYDNLITYAEMMLNKESKDGSLEGGIMDGLFSNFRTRSYGLHTPFPCGDKLDSYLKNIKTQIVGVVENHKVELENLQATFPFLKMYELDVQRNFVLTHIKESGQVFILINVINENEFSKVFLLLKQQQKVSRYKENLIYF